MLTVYTSVPSPRLSFTLRVIFQEVMGIDYKIVGERKEFEAAVGPGICYSEDPVEGKIHISPSGLLQEDEIKAQQLKSGTWDELPAFFMNASDAVPFDLFSAVFYLVSRYEEYLPTETDQYGRFPAEKSLAFRMSFLHLPIVDLWCKKLGGLLGIAGQCKNLDPANYRFQLTTDIDQPWLYLHKGMLYSAGALLRDLVTGRFSDFTGRIKALLHLAPDPADTFDYLQSVSQKLSLPIKYFILCQKSGAHDKNRSLNRKVFGNLIRKLDNGKNIGIHPSFRSYASDKLLDQEINWLSNVLGRSIEMSRQHYLLFSFPETCHELIRRGIQEDFTLGYSSQTGFRTGMARSCMFYDLEKEEETKLRLVPLMVMDRTLKDYQTLDPEGAVKEYRYYTKQIRAVGGEFVCLWHNDALSDSGEWKGWKEAFESLIEMQEEDGSICQA